LCHSHVLNQLNQELRLSGDITDTFRTVNGYLAFPKNFNVWTDEMWKKVNEVFERLVSQMYSIFGTDLLNTQGNKTNFFYTFAVPLNYSFDKKVTHYEFNMVPTDSPSQKWVHEFAKTLLRTQFYSMINQSVQIAKTSKQKQTLYLTPVGGGVFNNPPEVIASAVYDALIMAVNAHPDLLDQVDIKFLTWLGKKQEKSIYEAAFATVHPLDGTTEGI